MHRRELWVLCLTMLSGCTESGQLARSGCAHASDCSSGESCVAGQCLLASTSSTTLGCSSDTDCPEGWSCEGGACTDRRPECTHDLGCRPPNTVCESQRCVPGCNTPGSILVCSGEQVCDQGSGRCIAIDGCRIDSECAPPATICVSGGSCTPGCLAGGCSEDERCNDSTGRCQPESIGLACTTDAECSPPAAVCHGGECKPGCGLPNGIGCGQLEICDVSLGQCVPAPLCVTDAECPSAAPVCSGAGRCGPGCDQAGGTCPGGMICELLSGRCTDAPCTSDPQCSAPTPLCELASGTCHGCASELDCAEPSPDCDVTTGACVGCRYDNDCRGATPFCEPLRGVCLECRDGSGCPASQPVCENTVCRGCTANSECSGSTPTCHLPSGVCVGCVSGQDCDLSAPICDLTTGSCRGCGSDSECGGTTPLCDVVVGVCVACLSNSDCPEATPTCSAITGVCQLLPPQPLRSTCTVAQECVSQLCHDFGDGRRCTKSCNSPAGCDNGTTCHMLDGARLCIDPQTASTSAEDIDCTTNADCTGGMLCVWVEDTPGHFDQVCRGPLGSLQPQTSCSSGLDCQNGVCTPGINIGGAICRYTCSRHNQCPGGFSCSYIDYAGQSYTQSVKACLPVAAANVCGVDGDCSGGSICSVVSDGPQSWANACAPP